MAESIVKGLGDPRSWMRKCVDSPLFPSPTGNAPSAATASWVSEEVTVSVLPPHALGEPAWEGFTEAMLRI